MIEQQHVQLRVTCQNVRHKLMYCDERQQSPGLVDDRSSTRIYWCVKTQESLGPDGDVVRPDACNSSRSCYCGCESTRSKPSLA